MLGKLFDQYNDINNDKITTTISMVLKMIMKMTFIMNCKTMIIFT